MLIVLCLQQGISQNKLYNYIFENPNFQNYSMKTGLPSSFCYKVLQDKKGYMWFATLAGVVRFDGKHYTYFQEQSPSNYKIPSNWVIDLTEDASGNVWINTNEGICKYDYDTDKIRVYKKIVRGWGMICFTAPNTIYVSSWIGIDRYTIDKDSLIFVKNYTETQNNSISSLTNINNTLYATPEDNPSLIAIDNGVLNYSKNLKRKKDTTAIVLNTVCENGKKLLLNTRKHGLLNYDLQTKEIQAIFENELNFTRSINCSNYYYLNNDTFLIVGTGGSGLYIIDIKSKATYHYKHNDFDLNSICSNVINSVVIDNNNGIWLVTDKGVSYFHASLQKTKLNYFYSNSVIPSDLQINCVKKINSNQTLLGTANYGLFLQDKSNGLSTCLLKDLNITSIEESINNGCFIGTNRGLYIFQNNKLAISNYEKTASIFNVKMLNDTLLGVCTQTGFVLYNLKTSKILFREINPNANSSELITKDALIDKNGIIWVLKFFNGYCILDLKKNTFKNITASNMKDRPIDFHNLIVNSKNNTILISSTSGIIEHNIDNPNLYKTYTSANGLIGNTIEQVTIGFNNTLYYNTSVGLYEYSTSLQQSKLIFNYDNYPQKWFNQLSFSNDSILTASISNYYINYSPVLNFKNLQRPKTYLSKIRINKSNRKFSEDVVLKLSNSENNLEFDISSCVYVDAEKNTLYYKLNTDTSWTASSNGTIVFNNLLPNNYTLNYYETNNEGIKTDGVKTFSFYIANPFYKTWWFYVLLLFVVVVIVYVLILIRQKSQKRVALIRQQISRDLHDELGANVSSINILAQLIKNNKESSDSIKPFIDKLSSNSNQISQTINDIIWNVNPKFDNLESLINKVTRYASDVFDSSEIKYVFDTAQYNTNLKLSNVVKYNLYLICKEAINNIAKYSKASYVTVTIFNNQQFATIIIKDNGVGFDSSAYDIGNGLNNMTQRAESIKAEFKIESEINKGTSINIKIKL